MAHNTAAPYRPQDVEKVAEMLRGLEGNKGGRSKSGFSCKKATFDVAGSDIQVDSWKLSDWDYKKPNLPTYARGLFTTKYKNRPEIAVRGYDKFFNCGEVRATEWRNIETQTRGPYELSVKENGCIIFIAGLADGTLLVCSKHSTGSRKDIDVSHSDAGTQWVERHLASVGKNKTDLARKLREMNATAVAELCDDAFEEHVLEYKPEAAGLYLHGINLNLPEFATYPHHLVDQFADEWGFKKTMYVVKHDIHEVKAFLDGVAETGNYAGRDTEGFVIRCQSNADTGEWHDWFFKYKFEEPYLMYRQWRECTKALISGKAPRFKKHKKITEEYLTFARRQLHADKNLGKAYMHNHGIIKLRDDFLAERGLKGHEIIKQEAEQGEKTNAETDADVLLVPVATIGCGKTTISLALCKLFGWAQIQNDNITVKKGKPLAFATACTSAMAGSPVVIADRNNHQKRERDQIITDVSKIVFNAKFVAMHFVHDRSNFDAIREKLRARVLDRGDNHQTIHTSKGTDEIIGIMEGFMKRFEPVNTQEAPDDGFDLVINLNPVASSRENLETVINALYAEYPKLFANRAMPSADDMDAAIEAALKNYTVDIKHEIKSRDDNSKQRNGKDKSTKTLPIAKPKERKVEYFGVQLPTSRVTAVCDALFHDCAPDVARVYRSLKSQRRVQSEFHVTLIHRASTGQFPDVWEHLSQLYAAAAAPTPDRPYTNPEAKLGLCTVRLERLVWNDRLMAFVVRLSPVAAADGTPGEPFRSVNPVAHITVGTMAPEIKPKESNDLLVKWLEVGATDGIQELMVTGNVELEGVVKATLAR